MCGIYGLADSRAGVDKGDIQKRRDLLTHRGPDDRGIWISPDGKTGLGHRRLSIIDLSAKAHQPMVTHDGAMAIVFNGELYNFMDVRRQLENAGRVFTSHSDTEVALAAYSEWGSECLSRFNGMFAFAVYDGRDKGRPFLFMARDRAGKKPFYYRHGDGRFEFASELKAISGGEGYDPRALNFYLARGYIPGELCLAEGVKKLPPAHAAIFNINDGQFDRWRYWRLPGLSDDPRADIYELAEDAESLIMDSTRLRLVSDVPVGVLLSGGLDSSLVVAAAARSSGDPVKTFTISFPGASVDESAHARRIAEHFGTEHHELAAEPVSLSVIDEMAPFIDEPIADSSQLPMFLVSRLTRRSVTVALGGDGGDELFGGYSDYTASLLDEKRFGWAPGWMFEALSSAASLAPAGIRGRNRLASLRKGPLRQMIWGTPYFDIALRGRILKRGALEALGAELTAPELWLSSLYNEGRNPVDSMTRTHFNSILPDDFLVKVDRASMAHSLEMRAPFLDHRLVELAFSKIPCKFKVEGGKGRILQRHVARRLLPDDFDLNRKQGFSIPLDEWLRADDCNTARKYLEYLPDVIDPDEVRRLIKGHMKGRANGARLYALIMLGVAFQNRRF